MFTHPRHLQLVLLVLAVLASPLAPSAGQLAARSTSATSPSVEPVANIGGRIDAIAFRGTFAFAGEGATLSVLDIHDPAHPSRLAYLRLPSVVRDLKLLGNLAYITTRNHGLQIADVSVPAYPVLVGSYMVPGYATAVDVAGNMAYVSVMIDSFGNSAIYILDLANPIAPTLRSSFPLHSPGIVSQAVGHVLYISTSQSLRIMDVQNPSAPRLLSDFALPARP
ncbi:MAG TPA: hypothetical protein VFU22_09675, partial [Roseiflexaceae bacterium]|nr:hypothetical protein [Roseiflexaceae bacterium]